MMGQRHSKGHEEIDTIGRFLLTSNGILWTIYGLLRFDIPEGWLLLAMLIVGSVGAAMLGVYVFIQL